MNPYEAPQSELQSAASVFAATDEHALSQQLRQAYGYCAIAGRELFRSVLGGILFFVASFVIRTADWADVFDIRWLYVLGLYPLYALAIGWSLNRQGFLLLSMLLESNEARYCALKSRQLSLAKLFIIGFPFLAGLIVDSQFSGGIIICLWAFSELLTIRMQCTVLSFSFSENSASSPVPSLEQYRQFGWASMICFLMVALFSVSSILNISVSWPIHFSIHEALYLVGWVLYLLQLRAYRDCYMQLSQFVSRHET